MFMVLSVETPFQCRSEILHTEIFIGRETVLYFYAVFLYEHTHTSSRIQ
jgi:hypothetical protein